MGDFTKNSEILKKLALLDQSNQWLLYDDRFEKFFDFLAQNITNLNTISEDEVIDFKEIDTSESNEPGAAELPQEKAKILQEIQICSPDKIASLSAEIKELEQIEKEYIEILEMARIGKTETNIRLSELEEERIQLEVKENELLCLCLGQAKELEALQEENKQLDKESNSRFSVVSPPTLFHHLPLEDYCSKVDSCYQYLTLYMQQNFKMHDFHKHDHESDDTAELLNKINNLKDIIEEFTLKLYEEKCRIEVTFAMIDELQFNQIDPIDIHEMGRKSQELALLNEHHLKVTNDTLLSELKTCVQQVSQQRIEIVLLENTKVKLERALKRREKAKNLKHLIKDMLLNAELIWAAVQLDIERIHNRVDVQKQQAIESQACLQRIRTLHDLNAAAKCDNLLSMFLEILAELLAGTSKKQRLRYEIRDCLFEYETFNRQVSRALQNMLNGRTYEDAKTKIQEIVNFENHLSPIVYDSPIEAPLLYSVKYLASIFRAGELHTNTCKELRSLRLQFQTHVSERLEKDAVFRANQLLWVWFLRDQPRVLRSIEEVRRIAAAKTKNHVKALSGIKRKQ